MDNSMDHRRSKKSKSHKRKRSKSSRRYSSDKNPHSDDDSDGRNYPDVGNSSPHKRKKKKHHHKKHKRGSHCDGDIDHNHMKRGKSDSSSPTHDSSSDNDRGPTRVKSHVRHFSEKCLDEKEKISKETLDYNFDFSKYKTSLGKIFFRDSSLSAIALRLV